MRNRPYVVIVLALAFLANTPALRGTKITLHHFLDNSMQVRYKDRVLAYTAYKTIAKPTPIEDEKTIDARVNAGIQRQMDSCG